MELKRVSEHVWVVIGERLQSNIGIIDNGEYCMMIDSGHPLQSQDVLNLMKEHKMSPVKYMVYTHYHQDHVFGAYAYGGTVIAHDTTKHIMMAMMEGPWSQRVLQRNIKRNPLIAKKLEGFQIRLPEIVFTKDYEQVEHGLMVQFIIAQGSVMVHVLPDHILFTGDNLFQGCCPYLINADLKEEHRALEIMKELQPIRMIPGHGDVADQMDVEYLSQYLKALEEHATKESVDSSQVSKFWKIDLDTCHEKNMDYVRKQLHTKYNETCDERK